MAINSESILTFFLILSQLGLGFYVFIKAPNKKIGYSFAAFCFSIFLWTIFAYLLKTARTAELVEFYGRYIYVGPSLIAYFFLYFSFIFPRGDINKTLNVVFLAIMAVFLTIVPFPLILKKSILTPSGPIPVLGEAYYPFAVYFLTYFFIGTYNFIKKYRLSAGIEKNQIRYIFIGLFFTFIFGILFNLILPIYTSKVSNPVIGPFFTTIYIVFTVFAITKHRLMDISVVISRAVAAGLTIFSLGSIYIGLVLFYRANISPRIDLPFLILTILYGILVGQAHRRMRLFIQTTSDKVFLRGKYDYYQQLSEISSQITRSLSLDNVLGTLQRAFHEGVEASNPRIYLAKDFDKAEINDYLLLKEPTFINEELALPCVMEDKLVALIILGKKLSEEPYTGEDLKLLRALANQTAVVLEHIRIYEEMLSAQRQLLLAEKASSLGRVAAGLAHEIKNPLAAIKGMAQTLDRNANDPEFMRDFKAVVPKEINRLKKLIENLMKLSQPPQSKFTPVDVNKIIENSLKLFENQFEKNSIRVVKELDSRTEIKAAPEQLTQVFTNLILNAIQAMPKGGQLTVSSGQKNNKIIIEIADTGQGIPADKLKEIFEPFFSTKKEGLGLGLAITYKIIKDHGGEIEVESKAGEGTTFKLFLLKLI